MFACRIFSLDVSPVNHAVFKSQHGGLNDAKEKTNSTDNLITPPPQIKPPQIFA